jgi:ABC-type Fe3+/spermidine/putrescine transport system ATPase subunit
MLGDRLALMSEGRLIETGTTRELFLTPKTEFGARFFGAGQVLPCGILEKLKTGTAISSPLGVLTVPYHSDFDPERPMLFIPHDAMILQEPSGPGWKAFSAKCTGTIFDGAKLVVKLLLTGGENRQSSEEDLPFEVIAGARLTPPAPGSVINIWIDQGFLRFVKQAR